MAKFYCIVRAKDNIHNPEAYQFLQDASRKRNVEFVTLEANKFDYVGGLDDINERDIVYRLGTGRRTAVLEALVSARGAKGPYENLSALLSRGFSWGSSIAMQGAGVPIIPTIFNISKNEMSRLSEYVEYLGGMPIIVKASGGSHGSGVMKVDSLDELNRQIDEIADEDASEFVLRKYIEEARHYRLVVLGDEVIDTIEYKMPPDDFRTNASAIPEVEPRNDVSAETKDIAIRAVRASGVQFGGVDILIDQSGDPYVAEVNFPCNFARNQMCTGTDIAGKLVDFLLKKVS